MGERAWVRNEDPQGLMAGLRCFALDLDGTLYLGERWIKGAVDFLEALNRTGRRWVVLTNNSSKSTAQYRQKLEGLGLALAPGQVITSGGATAAWLAKQHAGRRVFLLGTPALRQEFEEAGILLDEERPELVVTAFDTGLDYNRLARLCDFVREGLPYVATHPDVNCPTEKGFVPDIGATTAYVQASTGRLPDRVIGKPNEDIAAHMLAALRCQPRQLAVVGDRLYTDIATGANNGLMSVLVLSGETSLDMLDESEVQPDLVFDSVEGMIALL